MGVVSPITAIPGLFNLPPNLNYPNRAALRNRLQNFPSALNFAKVAEQVQSMPADALTQSKTVQNSVSDMANSATGTFTRTVNSGLTSIGMSTAIAVIKEYALQAYVIGQTMYSNYIEPIYRAMWSFVGL